MLRYVGGGAFLPGVPARDLTEEEAKELGRKKLVASGLYEDTEKTPPLAPSPDTPTRSGQAGGGKKAEVRDGRR